MSYLPESKPAGLFQDYAAFVASRTRTFATQTEDILHSAVGCATEAGELLDTAKKMWVYRQDLHCVNKEGQTHRANLVEEAGDLMFYIQQLCLSLDIPLEHLISGNIAKLTSRYPQGYSDKAAAARADKQTSLPLDEPTGLKDEDC